MTASTTPMACLTTYDDLPASERERVLAELDTLDWQGLADAAGLTLAELAGMPRLSGMRGMFRTPYRLLAASCGFGYEGGPAQSLGQVLRRLGFTVNANTGLLDKGGYVRARQAAEYFGIAVPARAKDGPAAGMSLRRNVPVFTVAWESASTLGELAANLGQSSSGKTNARNLQRGDQLGLADKLSAQARHEAAMERRAVRFQEHVLAAMAERFIGPRRATASEARAIQLVAERARRAQEGCRRCGCVLPAVAPDGRPGWSVYCSDRCRLAVAEERRKADNLAAKAAAQGPCEHCGVAIVAGHRAKRFCSKSCAKKRKYAERTGAAAAAS